MSQRILRSKVYPSRLTDDDLDALECLANRSMQACPQFCFWFRQVIQGERLRRLEDLPPTRFGVGADWSGAMLSQAMRVLTALTYAPPSNSAGVFAHALLLCVNAMAETKLENVR